MLIQEVMNHYFNAQRRFDYVRSKGYGITVPLREDCANRKYFRILKDGYSAILMNTLPDEVNDENSGHRITDFVRIGEWLAKKGLHIPEIYENDSDKGFLILEDMGDVSLKNAVESGVPISTAYGLATDILRKLSLELVDISLPDFEQSNLRTLKNRIIDWYVPMIRKKSSDDDLVAGFENAWSEIESSLPPCPQCFSHIDFHAENLMWIPSADGTDKIGILDFQGAMLGYSPYDLTNLLEDARKYIPEEIRTSMISRYCIAMTKHEREAFNIWYRVLATQFHCRVIGQFVMLAIMKNKKQYIQHIPRLSFYITEALKEPVLAPLKKWFESENIRLEPEDLYKEIDDKDKSEEISEKIVA